MNVEILRIPRAGAAVLLAALAAMLGTALVVTPAPAEAMIKTEKKTIPPPPDVPKPPGSPDSVPQEMPGGSHDPEPPPGPLPGDGGGGAGTQGGDYSEWESDGRPHNTGGDQPDPGTGGATTPPPTTEVQFDGLSKEDQGALLEQSVLAATLLQDLADGKISSQRFYGQCRDAGLPVSGCTAGLFDHWIREVVKKERADCFERGEDITDGPCAVRINMVVDFLERQHGPYDRCLRADDLTFRGCTELYVESILRPYKAIRLYEN